MLKVVAFGAGLVAAFNAALGFDTSGRGDFDAMRFLAAVGGLTEAGSGLG